MGDAANLQGRMDRPITALRLDGDGRIADSTGRAAQMLGMTCEEMLGLQLRDLVAEQWQPLAESATARILCGDTRPFQLLLSAKTGERLLVEMAARRLARTVPPVYVIDWSEQAQNESPRTSGNLGAGLNLIDGLLSAVETERTRTAMKLDNAVAPPITIAKLMIEDFLRAPGSAAGAENSELLRGAGDRLRDALSELRSVASGLRPRMLDDLGVVATIEWQCRSVEQASPSLRVVRQLLVSEVDVPEDLKLLLFRLVEEGLRNALRHANASEVKVVLLRAESELLISVHDNGDGFDASALWDAARLLRGIGLASIRKRVEGAGGKFSIQSAKPGGTKVSGSWPLWQTR